MTGSPIVAHQSHKLSQVLRLFTEYPLHHLPVVDDDGKLIGIVSSNDLPKAFLNLADRDTKITLDTNSLDSAVHVGNIMTSEPVTISSNDSIENAARIFADNRFNALPVVDNGVLVGIVTVKDVIGFIGGRHSGVAYSFVI